MSGDGKSVVRRRFEPERQHFGVGGGLVGAAERFDAGLQKFGRRIAAVTEDRAEIAKARGLSGGGRGEIVARHRNGEIGAQAQLAAVRRRGQIHAPPDVLAGQVEKRLRRLQHGGRDAHVSRALVGGDQRLRPRVR